MNFPYASLDYGFDVDAAINSKITQTIDPANTTSTQLVTHSGLLDYMGASNITTNGVNQYIVQGKMFRRTTGETNDSEFQFIKAGVIDNTETISAYKQSGQYSRNDNRLATVKAMVEYIDFTRNFPVVVDGVTLSKSHNIGDTIIISQVNGQQTVQLLTSKIEMPSFCAPCSALRKTAPWRTSSVTLHYPSKVWLLIPAGPVWMNTLPADFNSVSVGGTTSSGWYLDSIDFYTAYNPNSNSIQNTRLFSKNLTAGTHVLDSERATYFFIPLTEDVSLNTITDWPTVTALEVSYLEGVHSSLQAQLNALVQSIASIQTTVTAIVQILWSVVVGGVTLAKDHKIGDFMGGGWRTNQTLASKIASPVILIPFHNGSSNASVAPFHTTSVTLNLPTKVWLVLNDITLWINTLSAEFASSSVGNTTASGWYHDSTDTYMAWETNTYNARLFSKTFTAGTYVLDTERAFFLFEPVS